MEDEHCVAKYAENDSHHDHVRCDIVDDFVQEDWVDGRLAEETEPIKQFDPHHGLDEEYLAEEKELAKLIVWTYVALTVLTHLHIEDQGKEDRDVDDQDSVQKVPCSLVVAFESRADAFAYIMIALSFLVVSLVL